MLQPETSSDEEQARTWAKFTNERSPPEAREEARGLLREADVKDECNSIGVRRVYSSGGGPIDTITVAVGFLAA